MHNDLASRFGTIIGLLAAARTIELETGLLFAVLLEHCNSREPWLASRRGRCIFPASMQTYAYERSAEFD